jgi:hypothetical protein
MLEPPARRLRSAIGQESAFIKNSFDKSNTFIVSRGAMSA